MYILKINWQICLVQERTNLFVNLVGVWQFAIDGRAVQRWDRHGLHGNELDFVGEPPARVCGARHPIDMFKDGGRGQMFICAIHRWRTWGRRETSKNSEWSYYRSDCYWDDTDGDDSAGISTEHLPFDLIGVTIKCGVNVSGGNMKMDKDFYSQLPIKQGIFPFVCEVDCFYAVSDSSADSDGWWEQAEHKATTETDRLHTDTAAAGQLWGLQRHRRKVNKLLPILFFPANHNRKESEFYWDEGDQIQAAY